MTAAGHAPRVQELTGLPIDPMFPGPKMKWLLDRVPAGRKVRLGTIDACPVKMVVLNQARGGDQDAYGYGYGYGFGYGQSASQAAASNVPVSSAP